MEDQVGRDSPVRQEYFKNEIWLRVLSWRFLWWEYWEESTLTDKIRFVRVVWFLTLFSNIYIDLWIFQPCIFQYLDPCIFCELNADNLSFPASLPALVGPARYQQFSFLDSHQFFICIVHPLKILDLLLSSVLIIEYFHFLFSSDPASRSEECRSLTWPLPPQLRWRPHSFRLYFHFP